MKTYISHVAAALLLSTGIASAQSPQFAAGIRIVQVNVINPHDTGPNADDEYYFILHPGADCVTPEDRGSGIPEEGSRGINTVEVPVRPQTLHADTIRIAVWEKGGGEYDCSTDPNSVEAGSDERLGIITVTGSADGVRVNGDLIAGTRVAPGAIFSESREVSVSVKAPSYHHDITLNVYGVSLAQGRPPA